MDDYELERYHDQQTQFAQAQASIMQRSNEIQMARLRLEQASAQTQLMQCKALFEQNGILQDINYSIASAAAANNSLMGQMIGVQQEMLDFEKAKARAEWEYRSEKEKQEVFTKNQQNKIHNLSRRMPELSQVKTPGGRVVLWHELLEEYAVIDVDAVSDIQYKNLHAKIWEKLQVYLLPVLARFPELLFIVEGYNEKLKLAEQLRDKPYFVSFAEVATAHTLTQLKQKFPELPIADCGSYPQKAFVFIEEVSRLKNLCATLMEDGLSNEDRDVVRKLLLPLFHLDKAVFSEKQWDKLPAVTLSKTECQFYYQQFKTKIFDNRISAVAINVIIQPLAQALGHPLNTVVSLRENLAKRIEERNDIENYYYRKETERQRKEEEKRRAEEERRQRREEKERRKRDEAERRRREEEERQRIEHIRNELFRGIKAIVKKYNLKFVTSKLAIDDRLIAESSNGDFLLFGDRMHWCVDTHIYGQSWISYANNRIKFSLSNKALVKPKYVYMFADLQKVFAQAKEILPEVDGIPKFFEALIKRHNGYIGTVLLIMLFGVSFCFAVATWLGIVGIIGALALFVSLFESQTFGGWLMGNNDADARQFLRCSADELIAPIPEYTQYQNL